MPDLTAQDMAERLGSDRFKHAGPDVQALTDPIVDTPMVVTLDQLQAYDLNPRVTRNPRYDDIKASIHQRGLDAPPAITRRPGNPHFVVRNGGNTRLSILRELWAETKNEKFFRVPCLFRPWSARGEIVALTGHLAENELHGGLSFIERALGIDKARELYEQEIGKSLTQTELARRLSADGYPVTQSHISRMQDAVRYLLPALPSVLYAGLGKPQIERLTALRKAASRTWERHAQHKQLPTDFPALFHDVLTLFDGEPKAFNVQRVQDELVGQLSDLLGVDYDALALELVDAEARQRALSREPAIQPELQSSKTGEVAASTRAARTESVSGSPTQFPHLATQAESTTTRSVLPTEQRKAPAPPAAGSTQTDSKGQAPSNDRLQGHIVSPAETTDRLQAIQRTIAEATGDPVPDFHANVVRAIPVQAGGLHPICDVWYIEPALDAPDRLRAHIAQLAIEIAQEAGLAHRIESVEDGIGFACSSTAPLSKEGPLSFFERAVLTLLNALSGTYRHVLRSNIDGIRLADDLGPLLQGPSVSRPAPQSATRLSDAGLVKFFRLIRLARRLLELESSASTPSDGTSGR